MVRYHIEGSIVRSTQLLYNSVLYNILYYICIYIFLAVGIVSHVRANPLYL